LAGLLRSLQAACDAGALFVPVDEDERKKYLLADTDIVGNLDVPADNEQLKKLVMILTVSNFTHMPADIRSCKVFCGTTRWQRSSSMVEV